MSPRADIRTDCETAAEDEIVSQLAQVIVELRPGTQPADVSAEASLLDGGLNLDSVALIELITAIEKRMGFEFLQTDLRTRTFASLRTLAHVVLLRMRTRAEAR